MRGPWKQVLNDTSFQAPDRGLVEIIVFTFVVSDGRIMLPKVGWVPEASLKRWQFQVTSIHTG